MIGYWGYLQFEVNDDWMQYPANFQRTAQARTHTFYTNSQRPKTQFLGADLGTVTFTMHLDQRFNSDIRTLLDEFVIWTNEGLAGELVIGTKPMGFDKWICKKAVIKNTDILHHGIIFSADVEVTLEEYSSD